MAMGNLYQTQGGSIDPGIPSTVFVSRPFDGKDKDKVPEDGWEFSISNTSSKAEKVTVGATTLIPGH